MSEQCDVVIVGARCAGSPLGAMLARQGLKITIVEQATFPRTTLSSHVIQADSLSFLNRLGVIEGIRKTGAPFMSQTDTRLDDVRFVEDFPLRGGDVGGAACIRRHVLDPILARAASDAGASLRMSTKVVGLLEERGRVSGVRVIHNGVESELRARLVVGADGRSSTVAKLCGARKYNVTDNERWYYWTYFSGADLSGVPTFVFHRWGDRHIFAAPADSGLYLVGVSPEIDEREKFRRDLEGSVMEHVMSCEPVAKVLTNAQRAANIFGILRFTGYFREPSGPGWVLVGDSGHFKDPAVGRGIGDAFRQVEAIVPEVISGLRGADDALDKAMAGWGRWRDRQYADYYWLATDIGKAGVLPAIMPEIVQRLHARGQISLFLDLFSHRAGPWDLLTPPRVLSAVCRLLRRSDRRAHLQEIGTMLSKQARRLWVGRRPVFDDAKPATIPSPRGGTADDDQHTGRLDLRPNGATRHRASQGGR